MTSTKSPTLLNLKCVGNETEILSCTYMLGSSCGVLNDAHVVCQSEYFHVK